MPLEQETEGLIRFRIGRADAEAPGAAAAARALDAALHACRALGVVGRDPDRYDGLAFGNVSIAEGTGFWITGTQTADRERIGVDAVVRVTRWDLRGHALECTGRTDPSSEAMTHAALHEALGAPLAVIHGHVPELWTRRGELELPTTPASARNGTPELALAVLELAAQAPGLIVMGGHTDGVLAFAPSPDAALTHLRDALVAARGNVPPDREDPQP